MGSHNIKTKMAAKAHPEDHIADASITTAAVGDLVATEGTGWGASTEANFDKIHAAIDTLVTDVTALATAVAAINAALEEWGITKSS